MFLQLIAPIALGDEIDEGVIPVRLLLRQLDRRAGQEFVVKLCVCPTTLDQLIEAPKAIAQDHGLQCIKPRHVTEFCNGIPIDKAVIAQQAHACGNVVGIGGDEAAVAERIENLQWMSGETARSAEGTGPSIVMTAPHRLGRVFHHREIYRG